MTEFFKTSSAQFATTHHLVRWIVSISHTILRFSQRQTWQSFMFHLFLSLYYQVVSLTEYQRRIDALNSEDLRSLCKRLQVPWPALSAPPPCSTSPAAVHTSMTRHSLHMAGLDAANVAFYLQKHLFLLFCTGQEWLGFISIFAHNACPRLAIKALSWAYFIS